MPLLITASIEPAGEHPKEPGADEIMDLTDSEGRLYRVGPVVPRHS